MPPPTSTGYQPWMCGRRGGCPSTSKPSATACARWATRSSSAAVFSSPFTAAACLRGTDQFARDLRRDAGFARAVLERCSGIVEEFAGAVAEAGGVPMLVDPVASGSVISRAMFETFALPTNTRALAKIKSLGMPPVLHICGRTEAIIDLMADTGAALLSVDVIDLATARTKIRDRVALMGNVRPTETLLEGTPDAVRAEARRCLAVCADSPRGFVLASGCEVPLDAPPANVAALIEVAREA